MPNPNPEAHGRIYIPFIDGLVMVASDPHYNPKKLTIGHRACVKFVKKYQPDIFVMNGDVLDASTMAAHPPQPGWQTPPTIADEIAEGQLRLAEIRKAGGKNCRYIWPLGNHDARFSVRLASLVPELVGVKGTQLQDHFPDWEPCWSVFIGGEHGLVVKHRFKGGVSAANALWSGRSMATGHHHGLRCTPHTNYNGTYYAIDTGTLADPLGPQFSYSEDNPRSHRQGFVLIPFVGGSVIQPELVEVYDDNSVVFRGEVVRI